MHYSDFNSGVDGLDFRPEDILDVDDANDEEMLKKLKLEQSENESLLRQHLQ